jgi:uncharacterized membrane protein
MLYAAVADSTPTTFVPADDRIFAPLAHGSMWLALGIMAGLLAIGLTVWMVHAVPDAAAKAEAIRVTVKGRYLAEIDALHERFASGELTERQLHHELSRAVRRFATEHGAPGALSMTAADLDAAGHDHIAGVVSRYQPPQFMAEPASDPPMSVAAARELIEAW